MLRSLFTAFALLAIAASLACSSGSDTAPTPTPAACADGLDNDNDGRIDFPDDTGCSDRQDTSEANAPINDIIGVTAVPSIGSTLQVGTTVGASFTVTCAASYVVSVELVEAVTGTTLLPIGGLGCGTTVINGTLTTVLTSSQLTTLQGKQMDIRVLISTDASRTTVLLSRVVVTAYRT